MQELFSTLDYLEYTCLNTGPGMFDWIKNLFSSEPEPDHPEPMDMFRKTGSYRSLQPSVEKPEPEKPVEPETIEISSHVEGHIEDAGPGKNVLVRKRFVREDTGTHETLTILDDSLVETSDDSGIDPYNTGEFDRSKHWDTSRFRK